MCQDFLGGHVGWTSPSSICPRYEKLPKLKLSEAFAFEHDRQLTFVQKRV